MSFSSQTHAKNECSKVIKWMGLYAEPFPGVYKTFKKAKFDETE